MASPLHGSGAPAPPGQPAAFALPDGAEGRATRHARLPDPDGGWPSCRLDGLEAHLPDGRVELVGLPSLTEPSLAPGPGPFAPDAPSGLARTGHHLYLADAPAGRLVRTDPLCPANSRTALTGHPEVGAPSGLCTGPHGLLYAAVPARGHIAVLTRELRPVALWAEGLTRPVSLAADGERALYVLDVPPRGLPRLVRLRVPGGPRPDPEFARRSAAVARPLALATARPRRGSAPDGLLYVGDADTRAVHVLDRTGAPVRDPLAAGTVVPQALAVSGNLLYVADRVSGEVRVLDRTDGRPLGSLVGFRGPVAALAVAPDGTVHLKPGAAERLLSARPATARTPRGTLETGPLDAGEEGRWTRAVAEFRTYPRTAAHTPGATGHGGLAEPTDPADSTRAGLEFATGPDPGGAPDWVPAAGPDTLLTGGDRYLWLRVTLERSPQAPAAASPVLTALRAEAAGDDADLLAHLPQVYARAPGADPVRRLLALAQSVIGEREQEITRFPRRFDPVTAPAHLLPVLAHWLALDLPPDLPATPSLRELLSEVPESYRRRGTPGGIARALEIHTGARPLLLLEEFRTRGVWQLDGPSRLGTDTVLAPPGRSADPFEATAHRFTAVLPGWALDPAARRRAAAVLEAEKPAHTAVHPCFVEPRFRVGIQARLGVDAIVAGPPAAHVLELAPGPAPEPDTSPGGECRCPNTNGTTASWPRSTTRPGATATSTASSWTYSSSRWSRST
ncbi:phage tail protein [Streptomyces sp. NPDC004111]|uniref:phage tail protein n=1 Tax=Streptomyces sp. NPDC004111 TaxID=3364690 RepID=UPI00367E9458